MEKSLEEHVSSRFRYMHKNIENLINSIREPLSDKMKKMKNPWVFEDNHLLDKYDSLLILNNMVYDNAIRLYRLEFEANWRIEPTFFNEGHKKLYEFIVETNSMRCDLAYAKAVAYLYEPKVAQELKYISYKILHSSKQLIEAA